MLLRPTRSIAPPFEEVRANAPSPQLHAARPLCNSADGDRIHLWSPPYVIHRATRGHFFLFTPRSMEEITLQSLRAEFYPPAQAITPGNLAAALRLDTPGRRRSPYA